MSFRFDNTGFVQREGRTCARFCLNFGLKKWLINTKRREDVHSGLRENLNLGPSEWQLSVLTTTPCHIHI